MNEYALIGHPLGHSFSADYFNSDWKRRGIDARYYLEELTDIGRLPELFIRRPGLRGFNVTIPYKQQILPYLDELTPEAAEIGAVNTVMVLPDRRLKGHNTDCEGFMQALRPLLPILPNDRKDELAPSDLPPALVLGTGGAAQAARVALGRLGYRPRCVSRFPVKGDTDYASLSPQEVWEAEVVVNATPAGMYPEINTAPPFPYQYLRGHGQVCFDMVYNPADTLFMRICRAHGCTVQGGLSMLHAQAEAARRFWQAP